MNPLQQQHPRRFPEKMAQLADDYRHGDFVRWSRPYWVLAFHRVNFEDQFLRSGRFDKLPISTCHWASFVRQLNLHGFRKLRGGEKNSQWVFYQRVDKSGFACPVVTSDSSSNGKSHSNSNLFARLRFQDQCVPTMATQLTLQ